MSAGCCPAVYGRPTLRRSRHMNKCISRRLVGHESRRSRKKWTSRRWRSCILRQHMIVFGRLGRLSIVFFRLSRLCSNLVKRLALTRLPVHSRAGCAFACTISTNQRNGTSSCLRFVTLQGGIPVVSILLQRNPLRCRVWYSIQ